MRFFALDYIEFWKITPHIVEHKIVINGNQKFQIIFIFIFERYCLITIQTQNLSHTLDM